MKIGNIELTKENLFIVSGAGAVAIAIVVFVFIYMPLLSKLKSKSVECGMIEKDLMDARMLITSSGNTDSERILIKENEVGRAMDELAKYGKLMGVNFISIKPGEAREVQKAKYKIMPIEIEIESTDHKLSDFIGSLDSLKKGLVKVRSFNITPKQGDNSLLDTKLGIDLYISGIKYE